jgi:DNA-binding PadR family transcriptional regulator
MQKVEAAGLVVRVSEEGRRKTYELTDKGTRVIQEYLRRLRILVDAGAEAKRWPQGGDPS